MMVKTLIRGQNGEFTSKLLEIMNMHAAIALLDRETTQQLQIIARESQLTQFNKSLGAK